MHRTKRQMLIGGTIAVIGWLVLFAMVIELLPQYISLYMIAYAVTLGGFMIGMFGAVYHMGENMKKHRRENNDDYNEYDEYD